MNRSAALRDDAHAMSDDLVQLRHRLHRRPETGLQLPRTQEIVLEALDDLDLDMTTGTALTVGDRGAARRAPRSCGAASR